MRTTAAIFADISNKALVTCSLFMGTIWTFFKTFVFADFKFAGFLFTLVFFDSLLGLFFAIRHKDFDPSAFGRFLEKVFFYIALLSVGHVLSYYSIGGEEVGTFVFVKSSIYSGMILREVTSILKFGGKRYPEFLRVVLKYFRGFNEQGLPERKVKK